MDLDIRRVIKSIPKDYGPEELAPLLTPWGEALGQDDCPDYGHPRPLLARESWMSLDGWWECSFVSDPDAAQAWRNATPPETFDQRIRVPFSPEASLSGVGRQLQPDELLWYHRSFEAPTLPDRARCLLHFDAVDFACAVYVNGAKATEHQGCYLPFEADITEHIQEGPNELTLCVFDPSETGMQLRGKQRLHRGGMWYTAQSGIWQSVWLEVVPSSHVKDIDIEANPKDGSLLVSVRAAGVAMCEVYVLNQGEVIASGAQSRRVGGRMDLAFDITDFQLWSPENPQIYDVRVCYGEDVVWTYFAFRTIGVMKDEEGTRRISLNGSPIFLRGLLDQGYWPDGLMTAPSLEAMAFDIKTARELGFNLLRKHIKVEPQQWYALCDRIGMLVLQDMPTGGAIPADHWSRDRPTLWRHSWHSIRDDTARGYKRLGSTDEAYRNEWTRTCLATIKRLQKHPCVISWVLFNESWGQFDSAKATQLAWDTDPGRPVLSTSGWYDQGAGDIRGVHNYFRGMHVFADPYARKGEKPSRVQMLSEFGGLTWRIEDHSQLDHTYGYAEFETKEQWLKALRELWASVDALEKDGLSGFVYTQVSDVEEETNGLLTYDRRVNKLAEES